jgi:hypothetical protein
VGGAYPFAQWRPGEALHDIHRLHIPARAAAGGTRLTITLLDAGGTAFGTPLTVPGPEIRSRLRQFEMPSGFTALGVEVGGLARLEAYQAPASLTAGSWPVTLAWRALAETERSYAVTVQLLDELGALVAQHDGLPDDGSSPTSSWLTGEVALDHHDLVVPVLAPGRYTLIAALYDRADGQRLTVGRSEHVELEGYDVPR